VSAVPGLGNANLRLKGFDRPDSPLTADVNVEMADESDKDRPEIDQKGNILRIEHSDGSVTVSLDGSPIGKTEDAEKGPLEWFGNLAEEIDEAELSTITEALLVAIRDDELSRQDWVEGRAKGIELLGLKLETPNSQGASEGAPVEGMSKVRHPLLLEAVLRFQANARSELLPTDGPVKIRNDDNNAMLKEDQLANDYERDMNHYLTAVATEYYPDTDRMLLMLGFGGTTFKKIYKCPLRNRPVSESVDAEDIIVNQNTVNLENARRITHRTFLRPSTVKRLQILGVYRDVTLNDAIQSQPDAVQKARNEQQGVSVNNFRPDDRDREVYEVCCELDIKGYEHQHNGKPSGLEVPYVVTIDKSSRKTLSLVRNYDEKDKKLPTARKRYVKYTFVPGLGFYDIGLLHILGNTTNAVTAAWREMLDNGMFANFPGFLMAKSGTRQNTSIFRVPPGGGAQIDTQGVPINQSVMALPYTTAGMPALMSLVQDMVQTGQRVGGTSELQVGEGKADAPVGTTLALIDQAVKVMNSVHKRLHAAQSEEFQLLVKCFKENPETFWMRGCKSKTPWDEAKFMEAASNCELVPQADPNTASMGQRVMKIQGLMQLQQAAPNLMDPIAIVTAAIRAIGWANPEQFLIPKAARDQPPPQLQQMQAQMANEKKAADAKESEANAKLAEAKTKDQELQEKIKVGHFAPKPGVAPGAPPEQPPPTPMEIATAQAKVIDAHTRAQEVSLKAKDQHIEDQNRDQDRAAKERDAMLGLAKALIEPGKTVKRTDGSSSTTAPKSDGVGKKAVKIKSEIDQSIGPKGETR